jgi:hypothetical protein
MATLGWLHRADGVILSTPNCVRLTAAFGVHPSRRGGVGSRTNSYGEPERQWHRDEMIGCRRVLDAGDN